MKRITLLLLFLAVAWTARSQRMEKIKADPDCFWVEIISEDDPDAADRDALEALSGRIAPLSGFTCSPERAVPLMKTYLGELALHSGSIRSGLSVLRYIRRDEIGKVFDQRSRLARDLLSSADAASRSGNRKEAFSYYFWAETYLKSLPGDRQGALKQVSDKLNELRAAGYSYHPESLRMGHLVRETATIRMALMEPEKKGNRTDTNLPSPVDTIRIRRDTLRLSGPLPTPFSVIPPQEHLSFPAPVLPEIHEAERIRALITLSGAYPADSGYGFTAGLLKGFYGGYASFHGNFRNTLAEYDCLSDGTLPGGGFLWTSPKAERARNYRMLTAGYLGTWSLKTRFSFYAGAGYGIDETIWKDADHHWARVSDISFRGIALEAGGFYSIPFERHYAFVMQAGIGTISLRSCSLFLGLGIEF